MRRFQLKPIFEFLDKFQDSFLFIGICCVPFLSIIRAAFMHADPSVKFIVPFLILFANFIIILLVFYKRDFKNDLIYIFLQIINTKLAQNFLFCCLFFEQLIFLHPVVNFFFILALSPVILISLDSYFLSFILQLFLILGLIYYRLRRSILNEPAFEAAGLKKEKDVQPYTWATLLRGLNEVVFQKLHRTDLLGTTPAEAGKPFGAASAGTLIINRRESFNGITYPFFPLSLRQHMSTRAAFSKFFRHVAESFHAAPLHTTTAVTGAVATATGGVYIAGRDYQNFHQRERLHKENLALESAKLEEQKRLHKENLAVEYAKLEEQKRMHQENLALEYAKLAEQRESRSLQERMIEMTHNSKNIKTKNPLPSEVEGFPRDRSSVGFPAADKLVDDSNSSQDLYFTLLKKLLSWISN